MNCMIREVVLIDEQKCDGCGLCIPSCREGALRIVDGKARLVSDRLCDGLGACLGHCPKGAITVERREADAFDDRAAVAATRSLPAHGAPAATHLSELRVRSGVHAGGCPGSRMAQWTAASGVVAGSAEAAANPTPAHTAPSELRHWPVQLRLLSPQAAVLHGARLLVAADCVPVAYADFHASFLRGRAVVVACPKLDDPTGYVEKLAAMIAANDLKDITVVRMEVPCCAGILHAVLEARRLAGVNLPVREVIVSIRGQVLSQREIPADMPP
jgi:NAD-dependent dihydropyrimidine dehydrogenase PreA subunit